jgi:tRNA(fMet)-specific endonuclease VapC
MLVDTSAWIEFFRGRDPVASLVDDAIESNDAALCGPVQTELRRGLLDNRERRRVLPLLGACHQLKEPEDLWTEAGELGFRLRRRGVTPKTLDLLIAVYALSHSCAVLTTDRDFRIMQKAGVPLLVLPTDGW